MHFILENMEQITILILLAGIKLNKEFTEFMWNIQARIQKQ